MNVRGMSAVGQDADFAGERIKRFTDPAAGFVGPQIAITALPASWDRAETWNGGATEGGIPGTQVQYYEAYRLFGEALKATGRNITCVHSNQLLSHYSLFDQTTDEQQMLVFFRLDLPIYCGLRQVHLDLLQELFAHEHESVPGRNTSLRFALVHDFQE